MRPDASAEEYSSALVSGRSFLGVRKGAQKETLFLPEIRARICEPVRAGNGKRVKEGELDLQRWSMRLDSLYNSEELRRQTSKIC